MCSGHCVAQVRLVMRAVPFCGFRIPQGANVFLTYVQRFDLVPQVNASFSTNGSAGQFPEPSTSMYLLRRAVRANGSCLGDVIPLSQLRTLVDLIPNFGAKADGHLTMANSLEYSNQFWLNKYFDKEMFYALEL
jgi:hypothetical protein